MTNAEIYEKFLDSFGEFRPVDYRPILLRYMPLGQGVIVYGDNGDTIIYIPKVKEIIDEKP